MNTTIVDIEKIDYTLTSFQVTDDVVTMGSDEHLDLILDVQNGLEKTAQQTRSLVEYIESDFNNFTDDSAKLLISKIFPCFGLMRRLEKSIRETGILNEVSTQLEELTIEVNELYEITNDLSRFRANPTDDINSFVNE